MTFAPKHVPYREALRLVAERADIKKGQINPLFCALDEAALLPEIRIGGEWKKIQDGGWQKISVWFPSPICLDQPDAGQTANTDIRVSMSDIDKLWPSGVCGAVPVPEYISPFIRMMLVATKHFKITATGPTPKKEEIKAHFLQQKLPDGKSITDNQADMMATFIRPPGAMIGGQKKMG
jgi:hypothetical protein